MSKPIDDLSWAGVHGESSPLAQALEVARRDDVSAAQVARLALALAPIYGASIAASVQGASAASSASLGQVSASAGTSATVGAGASTAATIKLAVAVLVAAAIGTAGMLGLGAARRSELRAPHPSSAAQPSAVVAAPARVDPQQPQPSELTALPSESEREVTSDTATASKAAANERKAARTQKPRANAPVEAQLLKQAHAALASDAARALRLADEHRARFPHGALAAEREMLAVRALERQGRIDEAQKRIARAHRELPRSAPVRSAAERLGALR